MLKHFNVAYENDCWIDLATVDYVGPRTYKSAPQGFKAEFEVRMGSHSIYILCEIGESHEFRDNFVKQVNEAKGMKSEG